MQYVLVTGTNRGIGLEFTRQYAQKSDTHVIAATREANPKELQALAEQFPQQITILPLDVTSAEAIATAVEQVRTITPQLDLIIHNAAVNPRENQDIETIDADILRQVLEVNTVAPLMLTQAFLPLLRKAQTSKIIYMSTGMGSLAGKTYPGANSYCISKAAVNMVMRATAAEFKNDGVITMSMDPGWVKTDMGGPQAILAPEVSVKGMIGVIDSLTIENSGQFISWDGQPKEW